MPIDFEGVFRIYPTQLEVACGLIALALLALLYSLIKRRLGLALVAISLGLAGAVGIFALGRSYHKLSMRMRTSMQQQDVRGWPNRL
jgi:hypothetical protein